MRMTPKDESESDGSDLLPNEIWMKIFQYLPPKDVLHSISHTSRRWRHLVKSNLKRLPLIRVHLQAYISDVNESCVMSDCFDSMIEYTFTTFDTHSSDYFNKRMICLKGNDKSTRSLCIMHRGGQMRAEIGGPNGSVNQERVDHSVALTLLSHMCVEAIRIVVLKNGKRETARMRDEGLDHVLRFCEKRCSRLSIRSLLLHSQCPYFAWRLGNNSVQRLLNMTSLRSLTVENMPDLDLFSGKTHIPLDKLRFLRIKMDQRHQTMIENMLWMDVDGEFLLSLVPHAVRNLELNLLADVPTAITGISASHICEFVKSWRGLLYPWHIQNISFNTTTTISEFRTAATRGGLFSTHHLKDIPYCRFRTHHPSDPHVQLELACYGNGNATQWSIRTLIATSTKMR